MTLNPFDAANEWARQQETQAAEQERERLGVSDADVLKEATRRWPELEKLDEPARKPFADLLLEADRRSLDPHVVSGRRTASEQDKLTDTKVRGRASWHVHGRAMDIELHKGKLADYASLGDWWEGKRAGEDRGFWGGRWKDLYPPDGDYMHFQWSPTVGVPEELRTSDEREVKATTTQDEPSTASKLIRAALIVSVLGAVGYGIYYVVRRNEIERKPAAA